MPAIVLYLAITICIAALWHRHVQRLPGVAAIALVLLPFCFTGRALLTGRVYAPIDLPYNSEPLIDYRSDYGIDRIHNGTLSDLYMQMIPWQSAVRQSLLHGNWPLWNPHLLCGSVLAANMQSMLYDPFQLVALIVPHAQALTFAAAMTFFLAGFFTFAFARAIGLALVPSLIAAAGFMFCHTAAFFVGWPIARAWAYLPFLLFAVRLLAHETSLRAANLLTLAFVLEIVAGHPETLLHVVAIGIAYGCFELARTRRIRAVQIAAACGVAALLLTAILLLPFFDAARQTGEYQARNAYSAGYPFQPPDGSLRRHASLSLFPWYGGQPERGNSTADWEPVSMRVGAIVLSLAVVALFVAARRRETRFFAALAVVCAFAALNAWPVAHALHRLPLFDIAVNDRLALAAAFALAMLAAIAADELWSEVSTASKSRAAALIVVLIAGALMAGTWALQTTQIERGIHRDLITMLTLADMLPLLAVATLLLLRTPSRLALALVLGLVLLQRTVEDGSIYPSIRSCSFYPRIPILRRMQEDKSGPFRMAGFHFAFLPDAAALYGLEDARGYEAMTLMRLYETYPIWSLHQGASFNAVYQRSRPFLSFLNIKYGIGHRDQPPDDQWKVVLDDRDSRLFENTRVLPRAFIPRHIAYENRQTTILADMAAETDFGERAWIFAPEYRPHEIANGPGTLAIHRDGTSYDIDAKLENDAWVVLSESAWNGWRAYIDGRRVQTKYANHSFLGVFVPKGHHRLTLEYLPESFTRGRNISLATIAALAIAFALRRHRLEKPGAV